MSVNWEDTEPDSDGFGIFHAILWSFAIELFIGALVFFSLRLWRYL